MCYVKIGEFYRRRHLLPEFEKELEKAAILLKTHTIDDKYLTKYYNRKAALFTELYNNNDSTLFYAKKSLELAKKVKDFDNLLQTVEFELTQRQRFLLFEELYTKYSFDDMAKFEKTMLKQIFYLILASRL